MNNPEHQWSREEWLTFQGELFSRISALTKQKNEDYCPDSNPFANFDGSTDFGVQPIVGLAIRMSDKFQRLKSFCQRGELSVSSNGDQIEDIFMDLIGYSSLALGMLRRDACNASQRATYCQGAPDARTVADASKLLSHGITDNPAKETP